VIRTYIDSGVLIAAARGSGAVSDRALEVLSDPAREFVSSDYVRLEVLPKAFYFRRLAEVRFYRDFFSGAVAWIPFDPTHWASAFDEACKSGLSAFDALHVTAAALSSCDELITTERPRTAIHRTSQVRIVSIAP
jgi:predicted nucleic acid-binding protein